MFKTLGKVAVLVGGSWVMTVLFNTPRGDRICEAVGRRVFPDSVTK